MVVVGGGLERQQVGGLPELYYLNVYIIFHLNSTILYYTILYHTIVCNYSIRLR